VFAGVNAEDVGGVVADELDGVARLRAATDSPSRTNSSAISHSARYFSSLTYPINIGCVNPEEWAQGRKRETW